MPSAAAETTVGPGALVQYGVTGTVAALAIVGLVWLYRSLTNTHDADRKTLVETLTATRQQAREEVAAANERTTEERRRGDRLEAELARLNQFVQSQTMAALNDASRAVADALLHLRGRDGNGGR